MILSKLIYWLKFHFSSPIRPNLDCFKDCYKMYMKYYIEQIDLLYKAEQQLSYEYVDKEYLGFYFEHLYKNMLFCKEKMGILIDEQEPLAKIWMNYKITIPLYYEFIDYKKEYNFLFGDSNSKEEMFKRAKFYMKKLNAEKDFE